MGVPAAKDLANDQIISAVALRCGVRVSRKGYACTGCGILLYPSNFGVNSPNDAEFCAFPGSPHEKVCKWASSS